MRRKRSFGKRNTSPTDRAQVSATLSEAIAKRKIPDHELNVLGYGNVVRRFDLDEETNGPSLMFRIVAPYAAFCFGFTEGDISDQDTTAATNVGTADPTTALYPVTSMATAFSEDVWPILDNLFSSGTGTRPTISVNEVIRYQAMLIDAYSYCLVPIMINYLTYHFDWSKVAPFTGNVPRFLYTIAANLEATDVGLADTYLPLLRRFENKIAFPLILEEAKRMMTPMMSVDLHGRLQVPVRQDPSTAVSSDIVTKVTAYLDYLDDVLVDTSAVLTSFLPFPMAQLDPWNFTPDPIIDVDRDSGWFNSGVKTVSTFGDTGDPVIDSTTLCDEATGDKCVYYTRHTQPVWAEIKLATIFGLTDDVTDDEFQLLTPHQYFKAIVVDDAFDTFEYDGTQILAASVGFRYLEYVNCRYASTDVDYGTMKPGLMGAEISKFPIDRLMRIETSYIFSLPILKQVVANMAGSSVRELRYTIRYLVSEGIADPVK
jgi:hypothetical protein